jgi:isoleucyl-tRNA synthetase
MQGFGEFSGQNAKKHPEIIFDYLKKLDLDGKHFYVRIERYTHRYPACWRCKTELVWKVTDEWYIAMDLGTPTLRQRMIENAKKINWLPSFGLDRELDWLNNMHDWLISKKNRYWGLALPIWECTKCGDFDVIGSKEELNERSVTGKLKGTPHKPQIDEIKIKCSKCGEISSRIEPVGNPWLDAGIVPFSTISKDNKGKPLYLVDKKEWQKWVPADFITESFPGQFKNWFYSLIAMSTVMEDINPTKTILGYATQLGEDGRPMHKSWGNAIEFNEGADKIGVDVARWMFARQNPVDNMLFGYKVADEVRRRFHLKLWNVYNFFITYANLDGWKPSKNKSTNVLDNWILIRLNETINLVTLNLDKYDAYNASGEIEKFVDDLSLWYIRRSRDRVGPAAENEKDRNSFYQTTYYILHTLCRLLAPFTPFFSEVIFKNLTKENSVHLSTWPVANSKSQTLKSKLLDEMKVAREIVESAHAIRKEKAIPVRQPLNSFSTTSKYISKNLEYLIKDEINVKNIIWNAKSNKFDLKITPELEEEARVRDLIRKIQEERKTLGLNLTQKVNVEIEKIPENIKIVQWMMKKAQINLLTKGKFNVQRS